MSPNTQAALISLGADRRSQPLASVSDDILLDIYLYLEVSQILQLRSISHAMSRSTKSRSLWVTLAWEKVIHENLPWSPDAWPLTTVPTRVIETLIVRALLLAKTWRSGLQREVPYPSPTRCIRCPRGSVTWIHLVRSRWLLIGQEGGRLELWDLQRGDIACQATYVDGMNGYVSRGITFTAKDQLKLVVSTSTDRVYGMDLFLPHLMEDDVGPVTDEMMVLNYTLVGFSVVLDARDTILAFSRSTAENLPHVVDQRTGGCARLMKGHNDVKPQHTVDIQIRPDLIIVAKDWNIVLYSTSDVLAALEKSCSDGRALQTVLATVSLEYPGKRMAWQVSIHSSSTHKGLAFVESDDIVLGAYVKNVGRFPKSNGGWVRWALTRAVGLPWKPHTASFSYTDAPQPRTLPRLTPRVLKMCWGASGTRIAVMGFDMRCQNIVYPTVIEGFAYHELASEPIVPYGHPRWSIPNTSIEDMPWHCVLGEAAGIMVGAMCSGRVWVVDAAVPSDTVPSEYRLIPATL
ncbi:hypothetical protein FRB95_007815 [Tulasnella sp. JGI-2019a]|nr:hypothetical protein FRB95_007815 [Tulasnella sp. JGI-2019a]